MWVSVYVDPLKQFGSKERQGKIIAVVFVFYHCVFFLLCSSKCVGIISTQVKKPGLRSEWVKPGVWVDASPGVNQRIFIVEGVSCPGADCDVIVYYPTASVSNRKLAGGLAVGEPYRSFDASVLVKYSLAGLWLCSREKPSAGGAGDVQRCIWWLLMLDTCKVKDRTDGAMMCRYNGWSFWQKWNLIMSVFWYFCVMIFCKSLSDKEILFDLNHNDEGINKLRWTQLDCVTFSWM